MNKAIVAMGLAMALTGLVGCGTTAGDNKRMASATTPEAPQPSAQTTPAAADGQMATQVPIPPAVRAALDQAQSAVGEAQLRGVPTEVPYAILSRAQATAAQGDFATAQKLAQDAITASQQSLVQKTNNKAQQALMRLQRSSRAMRPDQRSRLQAAQLWLADGQGDRANEILNRLATELDERRR